MSAFTDIKSLANNKSQKPSWWRNQLFFYLVSNVKGVDSVMPGTAVTFGYRAEYGEKMQFWDKFPMVYIYGEDATHFWGANVHYLLPEYRFTGFVSAAPAKTLHKYLRSNVLTPLYGIENSEWQDIGLIPSEQFVMTSNGRTLDIPRTIIYKRL